MRPAGRRAARRRGHAGPRARPGARASAWSRPSSTRCGRTRSVSAVVEDHEHLTGARRAPVETHLDLPSRPGPRRGPRSHGPGRRTTGPRGPAPRSGAGSTDAAATPATGPHDRPQPRTRSRDSRAANRARCTGTRSPRTRPHTRGRRCARSSTSPSNDSVASCDRSSAAASSITQNSATSGVPTPAIGRGRSPNNAAAVPGVRTVSERHPATSPGSASGDTTCACAHASAASSTSTSARRRDARAAAARSSATRSVTRVSEARVEVDMRPSSQSPPTLRPAQNTSVENYFRTDGLAEFRHPRVTRMRQLERGPQPRPSGRHRAAARTPRSQPGPSAADREALCSSCTSGRR